MSFEFIVKNFRAFSDQKPARFSIVDGFTGFTGPNNSGKSTLIRLLHDLRPLFSELVSSIGAKNSILPSVVSGFRSTNLPIGIYDAEELFNIDNNRDIEITIKNSEIETVGSGNTPFIPNEITLVIQRPTYTYGLVFKADDRTTSRGVSNQYSWENFNNVRMLKDNNSDIYWSVDPLLKTIATLSDSMYIGPFRNVINIGGSNNYYDIDVGDKFVDMFHEWSTGGNRRNNLAAAAAVDAIRKIFEFEQLHVSRAATGSDLQVSIDGRPFKLHELGSGFAQFFIVMMNIAIKRPKTIMIDEPELGLHPTLQDDFLMTLASFGSERVLFATHSLGLARAVSDRCYVVRKLKKSPAEVADLDATPSLAEWVGELGFSGYRELGFKTLLLVEGPTDVKVFKQWLRHYGKEHSVVIIDLGGRSNITVNRQDELAELLRITTDISVIIDSEKSNTSAILSPSRQDFLNMCGSLGFRAHVTDRRATENYLTDRAIKIVLGPQYSAIEDHQLLTDAPVVWPKGTNWTIAREMTIQEINTTDIGHFLDRL